MSGANQVSGAQGRAGWIGEQAKCFGVVDISPSRIVVLAAVVRDGGVSVVGAGVVPAGGVGAGGIVDAEAAGRAFDEAFAEAERGAGFRIELLQLVVNGAQVSGEAVAAELVLSGLDGRVSELDLACAWTLARARPLARGRTVLCHLSGVVELDGVRVAEPVLGRAGVGLRVRAWRLHADEAVLAASLRLAKRGGRRVWNVEFAGWAGAQAVTTDEERAMGVLVLHLTADGVDYVLYRHGFGVHVGAVAGDGSGAVWQAGVWAMMKEVRRRLGADYAPETSGAGVVLTGEGAARPDLVGVAVEVFSAPVRVGCPRADLGDLSGCPDYAAALGACVVGSFV